MSFLRIPSKKRFLSSYTNEHGVEINLYSIWNYNGSLNTFMDDKSSVNNLVVSSIEKVGPDVKITFQKPNAFPFSWVDASYFDLAGEVFSKV